MTDFIPRTQRDIASALLAFANSDPDVAQELLPTDLQVGGLERAHVESLALLQEESDQRVAQGIAAAIPEACLRAFGFQLLGPQYAVGSVIVGGYEPAAQIVSIPQGTQVLGPGGVTFATTAAAQIAQGELLSAAIPLQAVLPGPEGNVPNGSITRLVSPISGVDFLNNASRTIGGAPAETTDAQAIRFAAFLKTLPRGTKEALEFAALSTAGVADARAIEPFMMTPPPSGVPTSGIVWMFIDDGIESDDLDSGLVTALTNIIEGQIDGSGRVISGYKAAGTVVELLKCPRIPVYVRAKVSLLATGIPRWTEIQANLTAAAEAYFDSLRVGEKASYQNFVTQLSDADQDLSEVNLQFWRGAYPHLGIPADPVPGYSDSLSAEDLSFYQPIYSVYSLGARGVLEEGTELGVTYPEWILV